MAYITGESAAKELFYNFPNVFDQAQRDWVKYKLGRAANLFTGQQSTDIVEWFADFPKAWDTVRANFLPTGSADQWKLNWVKKVDAFVAGLKRDVEESGLSGLGIAPIVVAGVLIVGGIAGALWGYGYIKKQANVSKLIDRVTTGKVSEEVLKKSLEAQGSGPGLFADVAGLIKWIVIGGVGIMVVLPALRSFVGRKSR